MAAKSIKPIALNQSAVAGWNDTLVVIQPNSRTAMSRFTGDFYAPDFFTPTDAIQISGDNALSSLQGRHFDGSELRYSFIDDYFKGNISGTNAIRERIPERMIYSDDGGAANYQAGWSVGTAGRMIFSGNSYGRPTPFKLGPAFEGPALSTSGLLKTYTFQLSYRHSNINNTAGSIGWSPTPYMYMWNFVTYPASPAVQFDPLTVLSNTAHVRIQGDNLDRFIMTGPSGNWNSSNNQMPRTLQDVTLHWHIDVANNRARVLCTQGANDFGVNGTEIFYSGFRSFSNLTNLGSLSAAGFGFSNQRATLYVNGVSVYGYSASRRDVLAASGRY